MQTNNQIMGKEKLRLAGIFNVFFVAFAMLFGFPAQADDGVKTLDREALIEKLSELYQQTCVDESEPCKQRIPSSKESKHYQAHRKAVLAKIGETMKKYPPGTFSGVSPSESVVEVVASIELDREGALRQVALVKSSGVDSIDDYVLDLVRRAEPYPPFNDGIDQRSDIAVFNETFRFDVEHVWGKTETRNQVTKGK